MRVQWNRHRASARQRGIAFELTFEQWRGIWISSGKWEQRGCWRGQFVMARKGDRGPYALGNVSIISQEDNHREAHVGKIVSAKTRQRMRRIKIAAGAMVGAKNIKAKLTPRQIGRIRATYKKYDRECGGPALAKLYGVSAGHICRIISGENW